VTTAKPDDEYGLLIDQRNYYGSEYVEAYISRREKDGDHPLGCSGDGETMPGYGCPNHLLGLALDGLGIFGHISDGKDPAFICHGVEYRNVYASDERKLARMLKAIKRVNARISKDEAHEPGDKLMALAKALKLSFVVKRIGPARPNPDWNFMSITEGRNAYRRMIEEAVETARKRVA
jgi:hypothetical protein